VTARVTVVVVTWNGAALLSGCLAALAAQQIDGGFTTWVVDNASVDGTADLLRDHPGVRVFTSAENRGFAGGNNLALARVETEYVALLNNDARPRAGWLAALVAALDADPAAAAVSGKVLLAPVTDSGSRINSAGGWLDEAGHGRDRGFREPDRGQFEKPVEVFYAPGTACLYRTVAIAGVGLFDDDFFLYYEDVDLGWRLRLAGWTARYEPAAVADHLHSATAVTESAVHLFHDGRNRLLTLTKNAPGRVALTAAIRFPVTVVGSVIRGERLRAVQLGRAWVSYLRLVPRMLRKRAVITRTARRDRAEVWAQREPGDA
jgi:N-acetylglucosaminyl-diphospho-decaprenol L-rhamnosyltransferase